MISEEQIKQILLQDNIEQKSVEDYTRGSITVTDSLSKHKLQPFDYKKALQKHFGLVYACANLNATRAASTPLRLYIKSKVANQKYMFPTKQVNIKRKKYLSGDTDIAPSASVLSKSNKWGLDFVEVLDHPVLDLVRNVNPYSNQFDTQVLKFTFLELLGNSYYHLCYNDLGVPEEMYVLPSQYVKIIPGRKGGDKLINYYQYGVDDNDLVNFSPEEIIHFKYTNTKNLYYGAGKIEKAWLIINIDEENWKLRYGMLKNNMRPDMAIIMKDLTSNAVGLDRYTKFIEQTLKGSKNAGKMIPLAGGDIDIKPLTWNRRDQGNDDKAIIERIAAIFGVPITKLMGNDSNYSNTEQGNISWLRDTIIPILKFDEERLNQDLLSKFNTGEDAFFSYDSPIPEDQTLELEKNKSYLQLGVYTPNMVLESEGYPPRENGDIPLTEINGAMGVGTTGLQPNTDNNSPEENKPEEDDNKSINKQLIEKIDRLETFILNNRYNTPELTPEPLTLNVNNIINSTGADLEIIEDEEEIKTYDEEQERKLIESKEIIE